MKHSHLVAGIAALAICLQTGWALAEESFQHFEQSPPDGDEYVVTVGSPIYTRSSFRARHNDTRATVADLQDQVSVAVADGTVTLPAGETLVSRVFDGREAFAATGAGFYPTSRRHKSEVILVDRDQDFAFDEVWTLNRRKEWTNVLLTPPLRYRTRETRELSLVRVGDEFRIELVVLGYSGHTLRLQYREFVDDMARPAFFQDVSYDLGTLPTVVAFRNAQFEILSATNTGIKVRLIRGLKAK